MNDCVRVQPVPAQGGRLSVPGDKSISHRAAMLSALAGGVSELTGFLRCEDCMHTLSAVERLGAGVEVHGEVIRITGRNGVFDAPGEVLDIGNSGTSIRLLAGLLAGQPFEAMLTGDESLRGRPMGRVAEPLRRMGAEVLLSGERGCAPMRVKGGTLEAIDYVLPVASAQVKGCVLLAGLFARGTTCVTEPRKTRDHTERMLQAMGVDICVDGLNVSVVGAGPGMPQLHAHDWHIPGDFSSAAFWMTLAAVSSCAVEMENVGLNPRRTAFLDVLRRMGARIEVTTTGNSGGGSWEPVGTVRVVGNHHLRGTVVAGDEISNLIDELPLVAIAGALAEGETVIADAGELRVKESDRISVVTEGLRRCGADVEELADGMRIQGHQTVRGGASISTRRDHRIAMAFSIMAMKAAEPITIEDAACVATSYPDFWSHLEEVAPGALCR